MAGNFLHLGEKTYWRDSSNETTHIVLDADTNAIRIRANETQTNGVIRFDDNSGTEAFAVYPGADTGAVLDATVDAVTTGAGLQMDDASAITTGNIATLQSTSEAMTSAVLLNVGHTGSGSNGDVTGNVAKFASSITDTDTSGTATENYDVVLISRTDVMNGAGGTLDADGALLKLESTATETAGTLTHDVSGIEMALNSNSSSDVYAMKITMDNAGSGAPGGIDFSGMADTEPLFKLTSTDTDLSSKSPATDAEAGWFPVDADGTTYAVPIYPLS